MSGLADTVHDPSSLSALAATQMADDVGLGATLAAPDAEIAERIESPRAGGATLQGLAGLPAALAPAGLSATSTASPQITLNSSVLPRVSQSGDAIVLSSSMGPRYATLKELGKGGMGEVDLVEDRDIGRTVAMKRLLAEQSGPAAVARFVDEVRTIGRLEHPNIVPIHDVGIDERGRFFFVMKYVDGETLEAVIDKLRAGDPDYVARFDLARRVQIFQQVLRALQFAHERGIIHRDIKPANVMVGRFGEVVLMDWGVARTIASREAGPDTASLADRSSLPGGSVAPSRASTTRVGALIGTPLYMSPEQARGANDQLDQRSDLYSAMLMFHEMLGLEHLRAHHKTLTSLLHGAQSDDPPTVFTMFASAPQRGIGAEYAHYIRKGLARDPSQRYQSASQMLEDLHLIASGRFRVQCAVTFMKRSSLRLSELVDRSPPMAMWLGISVATVFLLLLANAVRDLMG
ncbi:MAG: serine/threonine protein kinase [Sandaracinaceae bacterium]|nr:serine/threonine protein kinase [Sandaracinaceae bacterium]